MTIKQLNELVPTNHEITIDENGCAVKLWRDSPVALAAYGDFAIAAIRATGEHKLEISIKLQPVKEKD